jgi:hypothetical protein
MCALLARIVNGETRKQKAGVPRRHFRTGKEFKRDTLAIPSGLACDQSSASLTCQIESSASVTPKLI